MRIISTVTPPIIPSNLTKPQYHGSLTPNTLARPPIRGIHSPKRCRHSFLTYAFHAPQQQQPTRTQHIPTRRQTIASYRPTLPNESRMPDEWGYPSSSMPHVSSTPFSRALIGRIASLTTLWQLTDMPNNVQGVVPQPIASGSALRGAPPQALHPTAAAVPTLPTCRYPNCGRPVTRDEVSHELTEYCSPEHMRFVVLVLQGPPCSCSWC